MFDTIDVELLSRYSEAVNVNYLVPFAVVQVEWPRTDVFSVPPVAVVSQPGRCRTSGSEYICVPLGATDGQ